MNIYEYIEVVDIIQSYLSSFGLLMFRLVERFMIYNIMSIVTNGILMNE